MRIATTVVRKARELVNVINRKRKKLNEKAEKDTS